MLALAEPPHRGICRRGPSDELPGVLTGSQPYNERPEEERHHHAGAKSR